jgi:hypothetical protein
MAGTNAWVAPEIGRRPVLGKRLQKIDARTAL